MILNAQAPRLSSIYKTNEIFTIFVKSKKFGEIKKMIHQHEFHFKVTTHFPRNSSSESFYEFNVTEEGGKREN